MCGADAFFKFAVCASSGSSPRVRGRHNDRVILKRRERLIPACAGQTASATPPRPRRRAHPRVCGADSIAWTWRGSSAGSSPRVRGRRFRWYPVRPRYGLIPACAGQTPRRKPPRAPARAHPRVCGADAVVNALPNAHQGSSPRVRGRLTLREQLVWRDGLIPACAGQTISGRCR